MTRPTKTIRLHGTAIALDGQACLITGAPGSGKSTLAIGMIALGAELVADDQVDVRRAGDGLILSAPPATAGLIEARGVGILRLSARSDVPLALIVDLDVAESERLPDPRQREILGMSAPVLLGRGRDGLAAIVITLLRVGPPIPPDTPVG